jgi:hypothetical protein
MMKVQTMATMKVDDILLKPESSPDYGNKLPASKIEFLFISEYSVD